MADPKITGVQSNTTTIIKKKPLESSLKTIRGFKEASSSLTEKLPFSFKAVIANKVSDVASIKKSIVENKEMEGRYFGSKLNNVKLNSFETKFKTDTNDPLLYGVINSNVKIDFTLRVACKNQCGDNKIRYLPNNISINFDMKTPLREGPYNSFPLLGAMKKLVVVKMTPMTSAVSESGVQIDKYIQSFGKIFGVSVATGMCRTAGSNVCR